MVSLVALLCQCFQVFLGDNLCTSQSPLKSVHSRPFFLTLECKNPMNFLAKWIFVASLSATVSLLALEPPKGCDYDIQCVYEMEGLTCGDGSPSYYTVIPRRDSDNLLIFMFGEGPAGMR